MNPGNGTAKVDPGEAGTLPDGNNAVEQVFDNHLIWKIIGSYLNIGDLKACRLVSSSFHGMVMKETKFLERCLVSLKPHQITKNIFGSTSESWRNVILQFGNPGEGSSSDFRFDPEELEWLYPLMSNVEALSLRMEEGTKGAGVHPVLKRLLNRPNNLRALAMEPIFLTDETMENVEKFVWEDALENLEEFEILQPPSGWQNAVNEWRTVKQWLKSIRIFGKMRKLQVLKSYYYLQPAPEDELAPANIAVAMLDDWRPSERRVLSSTLARIAMINNNTLKQVTLSGTGYWLYDYWREPDYLKKFFELLSFSTLESATFYDFRFKPSTFTKYLVALPMLKELEFSVSTALPITILNTIAQRSDCLRKLKLQSSGFKDTTWQFLMKTKLEEFQLELYYPECPQGETLPDEALNCLPLTIRRLSVLGPLESNPIPALARLNPSLVTELEFIDSGDCFGDDTMKYFRENFEMLRKLNVTNAKGLTDAGFVGSSSESGSLSGIKGLRTLILRECGLITDATLKEIRFLELRYLDLSYNKQLTSEGYEGLLSTNPSLETLLMSCENVNGKKEHMCAIHHRLSSVVYRRLEP